MKTKFANAFGRTKYYRRLWVWIMTVSSVLISLFSLILYMNIEKIILSNEYDSNKKVLEQVHLNLNYLDQTVNNLFLPLMLDPDVTFIMYKEEAALIDVYKVFNSIKQNIMLTHPFIENVNIYNKKNRKFYSFEGIEDENESALKAWLDRSDLISNSSPLFRQNVQGRNTISYFLFDSDDNANFDGVIIVDLNIEWILNHLKLMNTIDESLADEIYLLDDKGQFVNTNGHNPEFLTELDGQIQQRKEASGGGEPQGIFQVKIDRSDYLITHATISKTGWELVKLQDYRSVFKNADTLRFIFLTILLIFFLLILFVSLIVTKRLYVPVGNFVKNISSLDALKRSLEGSGRDEFEALYLTFASANEEIRKVEFQKHNERFIRRNAFLKKLFMNSPSVTEAELTKAGEEYGIMYSFDPVRFVIVVLRIDQYEAFVKDRYYDMRSVYKFAMVNISGDQIGARYENFGADLDSDHVALIVNIREDLSYVERLTEVLTSFQSYFREHYQLGVSAFISDVGTSPKEITRLYQETLDLSMYRLVYGCGCILTNEMTAVNNANLLTGYSEDLEKKLIDAIKLADESQIRKLTEDIFSEIAALNYSYVMLSVMQLINAVRKSMEEINQSKLIPFKLNFNVVFSKMLNLETLDELKAELLDILRNIKSSVPQDAESAKNEKIAEHVKEIVEADYADASLCLQSVADSLHMSSKHLSGLFKRHAGMSVQDYIHQTRLDIAAELLTQTKLSISEITHKVGIGNEKYFYTLFRKRFGVTPREYILNKSIRTKP